MKALLYISLSINAFFLVVGIYTIHRMGGIKNVRYRIESRGVSKAYQHRVNQFSNMPEKNGSIIFLGNSITEQCEWSELLGNPQVLNRGISGDHCDGVRSRLGDLEKLNPIQIFLMIGINDLAYHPPSIVIEKYEELTKELKRRFSETEIILESVLPVNNKMYPLPMTNLDVQNLNNGIKKIALKYDLEFVNLYPLLLDEEDNLDARYTLDGLHLNGEGYRKIKTILEKKLDD